MKTYSRQKRANGGEEEEEAEEDPPSKPPGPSFTEADRIPTLGYIPPNHATLVGFRGLVLHHQYLRRRAQPDRDHAFRKQIDDVLSEGIFHPSIMITASENMDGSRLTDRGPSVIDKGDEQADELLYQRFKAAFLWPAIMSVVK